MAKRARGTTSRPGQRAPLRAVAPARPSGAPVSRPATLTADEEARAAELEAQIVAAEKAAQVAQRRVRSRRDSGVDGGTVLAGSIALRAAEEYRYVARDMRRILTFAGGLIVLLVALWIVSTATGFRPA